MVQDHLFTRAHTCMIKKISHHGARSHRQALWFMRQPNMNEKKESLICTAVFLDSCGSLMPTIGRRSLTQTGAVVHVAA